MAWHGIWYDLAGMVRCMVWPGGHGICYGLARHGIWYGLAGKAWEKVWPGRHGIAYGMA